MRTQDLLEQQILARYAIFDRPLSGEKNVIVDSFFPAYYLKAHKYMDREIFPVTAAAISEFASDAMQVPLVPRQDLIEMLGYKISDIKRLLLDVKRKELTLYMIGLGGTNSNTLYWLQQFTQLTNTPNLFAQLVIQENDTLSIDNLIRMPMSPLRHTIPLAQASTHRKIDTENVFIRDMFNGASYKDIAKFSEDNLRLIYNHIKYPYSSSSHTVSIRQLDVTMPDKISLLTESYNYLTKRKMVVYKDYFTTRTTWFNRYYPRQSFYYLDDTSKTVFYGAPDIETRQDMAASNYNLITATHGDDSATLALNPIQDTSLQVETYGVIKLGPFFMNQIRLAIGLLETLASDQDLSEKNKTLLDYSYTPDNSKCKRTWKVQSLHDGLLRSEIWYYTIQ